MTPQFSVDDTFDVQFVWRLPDDDYMRVVFAARVVEVHTHEQRYLVVLTALRGGVQEAPDGSYRPQAEMSRPLWARVFSFVDSRVLVAYEAASQPLYMRYATLIGEHTYFTRHNLPPSD